MKPKVNKSKCIGCGTCTVLAPDVFKMGDDNKAEIYNETGCEEDIIQNAVDSCPVQAISWVE